MSESVLGIIDDHAGFDALEADWRALSLQALQACIFMDFDWHHVWWQVYAQPSDRLHIVTVREQGELVALLPLYRKTSRPLRGASLHLLGTGESRSEEVASEYGDLLLAPAAQPGRQELRIAAVLDHLTAFSNWQRIELRCLLDDACLLTAVRLRHEEIVSLEAISGERYRVRLDGEVARRDRIGASRMKRIQRSIRASERDGGLIRQPIGADVDPVQAFTVLEGLSRERQRAVSRRSVFAAERFRRFHRILAQRWLPNGRASIVHYTLDQEPIAALYCFRGRDSLHYYQSGFASAHANRYMPLTLAHLAEMQVAESKGLGWYDLMRGEPPCYKDDFGCETLPMKNLFLFGTPGTRTRFERRRRWRARLVRTLARLRIIRR